jgi:DNA adenine methylase
MAPAILELLQGRRIATLFEPFAGSAALTLAAATQQLADHYVIGDSLVPLARLWRLALAEPRCFADHYQNLWSAQHDDPRAHYNAVRHAYNTSADPIGLFYLLVRCVKNAPRFNRQGQFNQSADHRRSGTHPDKVRVEVERVATLLDGRCDVVEADFRVVLETARPGDLVYLDPPWFGTTTGRDKRYHDGLQRAALIDALDTLNQRQIAFVLSYDGRTGDRQYGEPLPASLGMSRLEIDAGRSSQSTLVGRKEHTFESVYLSAALSR